MQQEAQLAAEPAASADTPGEGSTSVLDNDVDMDAQGEPEKVSHPSSEEDDDDKAAVETAASSPLTEEEEDYPFDSEMTSIDEGDD